MIDKNNKKLKVYGQSNGYNYKDVPTIILKGKWLEDAGFNVGTEINVEISDGEIKIIRNLN